MLHNTHPYQNIPVLLALRFWYAGMAVSFLSVVGDFHVLYVLTLTGLFCFALLFGALLAVYLRSCSALSCYIDVCGAAGALVLCDNHYPVNWLVYCVMVIFHVTCTPYEKTSCDQ